MIFVTGNSMIDSATILAEIAQLQKNMHKGYCLDYICRWLKSYKELLVGYDNESNMSLEAR